LRTNSNLVGCSIGRSVAFDHFAIMSTYSAARLVKPTGFGPLRRYFNLWVKTA